MKNIGTLYRFEMRKILSRKLTWVLLAFILMYCIRIIVTISISNAITIEYTNERGTLTSAFFTYKETFFKSREAARTIAGQPMEDAFFAKMGKSVPYFDENELAYFLLQDATYLHAYEMVDGLVENPRTITAEDFYFALEMVRERMWDKELTDSEIDYWREQVSKIDTPFIYNRYWVAMPLLLDFFYRLLDLLPLAAAVCLCTIFSEDRNMRVEALVFSSKNSRRPLFMAKMLAGITNPLLLKVAAGKCLVEGGSYEITYHTVRPLIRHLTVETSLGELIREPELADLLYKEIDELAHLLSYTEQYPLGETLRNLHYDSGFISRLNKEIRQKPL